MVCGIARVGHNLGTKSSTKEPACQCRRHKRCRFNPWVGIEGRRWQPTYPCLRNPMGRGLWQATVHGVAKKSDTLVDWTRSMSYKTVLEQLLVFLQILSRYCNQNWLKEVTPSTPDTCSMVCMGETQDIYNTLHDLELSPNQIPSHLQDGSNLQASRVMWCWLCICSG